MDKRSPRGPSCSAAASFSLLHQRWLSSRSTHHLNHAVRMIFGDIGLSSSCIGRKGCLRRNGSLRKCTMAPVSDAGG